MDFLYIWTNLFNPSGFMARRYCGEWSPALIRLHNISDFLIWTAYLAIPIVLFRFASRRREELPFRQVFWLFGLFILSCGTTHLMDIILFYYPLYRLSGAVKLVTAAASWGTVIALVPIIPRALAMRTPETLEREIAERERAEAAVRELNAALEQRVLERTDELEFANKTKDQLLLRERDARQAAEEASRSKDEFLATLSHELRTPLQAMVGWVALLRDGNLDEETTAHALETIERSTRSQTQIIEDILDVSRVITGRLSLQMQPLKLATIIEKTIDSMTPTAQNREIAVEQNLDETLEVVGDTQRLQQVMWNLLSNAIKFTSHGGRVEIGLRRVETNGHASAEMSFRDNGQGIAPDFLPHVFDRFRQADSSSTRSHGGLGLGLALVRHLVESHGGSVIAQSDGKNRGSNFVVTLPLYGEKTARNSITTDDENDSRSPTDSSKSTTAFIIESNNETAAPDAITTAQNDAPARANLQNARILVVDDDSDARDLIAQILRFHGAEVETAASAQEGFSQIQSWKPTILISDIGMPEENGYIFIGRVRALTAAKGGAIPAIALTAFAAASDRRRALNAGFQKHLAKPIDPATLLDAIADLLE